MLLDTSRAKELHNLHAVLAADTRHAGGCCTVQRYFAAWRFVRAEGIHAMCRTLMMHEQKASALCRLPSL